MLSISISDYKFKDICILETALTHPSIIKNKNRKISYERMEFLGDSILNFIITDLVYNRFKNYSEGELSVIVSNLVNSKTIVEVSKKLNLGNKIILDIGEERSGGKNNHSNLENVLEAVIAAIYLDSDFSTVQVVVSNWWSGFFNNINQLIQKDYKSQLQELLQKNYKVLPKYKTEIKKGQAHKPLFIISVSFKDKYKFNAEGKTKKEAEQNAAKKMINFINQNSI